MLSLSRYPGDSIILFDKDENPIAEIKINSKKGSQISVGIQAPRALIKVVRAELLDAEQLKGIGEKLL